MPELKLNPMSDVAKPGTTPAGATSKPVIVGHTPEVSDPMMSTGPTVAPVAASTTAAATVQPIQDSLQAPTPAEAQSSAAATTPSSQSGEPTGAGSMKSKLTPDSTTEEITKDAATDSDKALADKKAEKSEQEQDDEKQTRLTEIIESGEYNVAIGQEKGAKSATTFIATVLAILLVGAIAVFILTDLKIIDLGIKLPFHVFGQ